MLDYFLMLIGVVLVDNFVLAKFLGLCPILGASNRPQSALGLGVATAVVLTLATLSSYLLQRFILLPFGLESLQSIVFVVAVAGIVQATELVLRLAWPLLHRVLGVYLPLITSNCAVLGVILLNVRAEHGLSESLVYGVGAALGFTLVLILFSDLRERIVDVDVPGPFRGAPIALVTAGLMALAFAGFSGLNVAP